MKAQASVVSGSGQVKRPFMTPIKLKHTRMHSKESELVKNLA